MSVHSYHATWRQVLKDNILHSLLCFKQTTSSPYPNPHQPTPLNPIYAYVFQTITLLWFSYKNVNAGLLSPI